MGRMSWDTLSIGGGVGELPYGEDELGYTVNGRRGCESLPIGMMSWDTLSMGGGGVRTYLLGYAPSMGGGGVRASL